MGQLFTRISTGWSDQQTSTIITENKYRKNYYKIEIIFHLNFHSFVTIKPIVTKRKCFHQDNFSKKRKIDKNDRLSDSPRISKILNSSNFADTSFIRHSLSPMVCFS